MISLDCKLKNRWNSLLDEIKHKDLTREKHKKVCRALNCFEHFLVLFLLSVVVFYFLYLLQKFGVPVGIATSAVGLKIFSIIEEIKKYK